MAPGGQVTFKCKKYTFIRLSPSLSLSVFLSLGVFLLLQLLLLAKLDALATLALWANLKCEHEAIHMHSLRNSLGELQLTCVATSESIHLQKHCIHLRMWCMVNGLRSPGWRILCNDSE